MEELSEQAKQMLEALKADETPSKASSDRMWTVVAATGATTMAAAVLSKGKLLMLGALGITGVIALVIVGGPEPSAPPDAEPAPARGSAEIEAPADPPRVEAVAVPAWEPDPAGVEPMHEPAPTEPAPTAPAPTPAAKKPTSKGAPAAPAGEDLERELGLLTGAKAALRGGDAARALTQLTRHRKEFPRSSFAPERDFLRITALCDLGRIDEARRVADEFLRRHPESALTPQVEQVCGK